MLPIHQRCASDVRTDFLECTGRLEMGKVRNPGTRQRIDLLLELPHQAELSWDYQKAQIFG